MNLLYKIKSNKEFFIALSLFIVFIVFFLGVCYTISKSIPETKTIDICIDEVKATNSGTVMLTSENEVLIADKIIGKIDSKCITLKKIDLNSYEVYEKEKNKKETK